VFVTGRNAILARSWLTAKDRALEEARASEILSTCNWLPESQFRLKKLRRPSRGISIDHVNLMAPPSPPGTKQHTEHDNNWLPTVASLAVGTGFFAFWFWLLPSWLHFRIDTAGVAPWRWIAALGPRVRRGVPLRMGFRVDGTRHARTYDSAEEARCRGLLPVCAEPDVPRIHHRMDRPVDRLWASKLGRRCDRLRSRARRSFVRRAL
jgi:hypothetical protein